MPWPKQRGCSRRHADAVATEAATAASRVRHWLEIALSLERDLGHSLSEASLISPYAAFALAPGAIESPRAQQQHAAVS